MLGLLMTLLAGVSVLIGMIIVFLLKNSKKLTDFSISMAAGVMTTLLIFELIPESFELLSEKFPFSTNIIVVLALALIGIFTLKTLDLFIPDHDHEEKVSNKNLFHIGLVSSIALILHNLIEGMAIYSTAIIDNNVGLLLTIGICLHNIPLGIMVTSTLYKSNKSKKKTILILLAIALSTLVGGLLMLLLSALINEVVRGILLSITVGMIIYIILFELLSEMLTIKNKKITILGTVSGVVIFLLTLFFE